MPAIRSISRCIAALAAVAACSAASAETIWGYTNAGQNLVSFSSAAPNTILTTAQVTGMNASDSLRGIDFRSNGTLYGMGSQGRLYTINTATAVATQVGAGTFAVALSGTSFGFDFDPAADVIHITSDTARHMRVDPNTGAVIDGDAAPGIQGDANLAYAAGDPHFGATPNAVGLACIGSLGGPTSFRVLDYATDKIVSMNAATGALTTIGATGIDAQIRDSFDYSQLTGVAYASMFLSGSMGRTSLYTINLNTGAATIVGAIGGGGGLQIDGISAFIPEPGAATLLAIACAAPALGLYRRR